MAAAVWLGIGAGGLASGAMSAWSSSGEIMGSPDRRAASFGSSSSFCGPCQQRSLCSRRASKRRRASSAVTQAAKLPAGVDAPKEEPNLPVSLWGFTERAEVWNSRAAMIGIVGLVAVEFFARRGVLELIGVDVGKGLNLPL